VQCLNKAIAEKALSRRKANDYNDVYIVTQNVTRCNTHVRQK